MILDIIKIGGSILEKAIPDKTKLAEAKMEFEKSVHEGKLKETAQQIQVIGLEAQSDDKWVSRARPSFLYVMYIMILASIPAGIASIWFSDEMNAMLVGLQQWLAAIPTEMWALFGTGYLGYTVNREKGKAARLGQEQKQGLLGKIFG